MDCSQCSNNLTAYLDGELLSSYEQEVSSHLQACTKCTRELRKMEASAEFVEEHAHNLELSPDLWNNLYTRIAPMPAPGHAGGISRLWAKNRWLTAAVAVAATVVLALVLGAYLEEQREIQRYMSDYILERESGEQITGSRINAAQSSETGALEFIELENPFVTTKPVSLQNPFR